MVLVACDGGRKHYILDVGIYEKLGQRGRNRATNIVAAAIEQSTYHEFTKPCDTVLTGTMAIFHNKALGGKDVYLLFICIG